MKCLYPGCDRERLVGSSYCQWHQESHQSEGVIETSADDSSLILTADSAIESFSSTDPGSSTNDYPRPTLEVSTAENPVVGERATITEGWGEG